MSSEYLSLFLTNITDELITIDALINEISLMPDNEANINDLFRSLHTFKGNSALCELPNLSKLAHVTEDLIGSVRDKKIEFNDKIKFLLEEGVNLFKNAILKIKIDVNSDSQIIFENYKLRVDELLKKKIKKQEYVFDKEIKLTESDVEQYFKKYSTFKCNKLVLEFFEGNEDFLALDIASVLVNLRNSGIDIIKANPDLKLLSLENFDINLCEYKVIVLLDTTDQSHILTRKICEENDDLIKNFTIVKDDIKKYVDIEKKKEVKKVEKELNYYIAVIKYGDKIVSFLTDEIIKVLLIDKVVWVDNNQMVGIIRYSNEAVPVINIINKYSSNKVLLLKLFNSLRGIFIDEILEIKNIKYDNLFIDSDSNQLYYKMNDKLNKIYNIEGFYK